MFCCGVHCEEKKKKKKRLCGVELRVYGWIDVCTEEYVDINIINRTRGITACSLRSNLVFVAYY